MPQDYFDILEPFDYIYDILDDNKATLGIRYIARHDEDLIPEYPAVLMQSDNTDRELHATQMYKIVFHLDFWIFHAELSSGVAVRSRKDIELATGIRKLLHAHSTLGGHIIFGFVDGEFPGVAARVIGSTLSTIVTTRLTWQGQNRVRFQDS